MVNSFPRATRYQLADIKVNTMQILHLFPLEYARRKLKLKSRRAFFPINQASFYNIQEKKERKRQRHVAIVYANEQVQK